MKRSGTAKLCGSLQTTVPTTFSTNPVISVFVGLKHEPDHFQNHQRINDSVEPIPVIPPVDPIPNIS